MDCAFAVCKYTPPPLSLPRIYIRMQDREAECVCVCEMERHSVRERKGRWKCVCFATESLYRHLTPSTCLTRAQQKQYKSPLKLLWAYCPKFDRYFWPLQHLT